MQASTLEIDKQNEQYKNKIANNIAMKATAAGKQIPEIAGKYAPQTGSGNPALSPDQGGRPSNVEQQGDISQ
jgi:hypothetical protein